MREQLRKSASSQRVPVLLATFLSTGTCAALAQQPIGNGPQSADAVTEETPASGNSGDQTGAPATPEITGPTTQAGNDVLPTIAVGAEAPPAIPASTPDEPEKLAEVIVTATKRAESVRNIPASITAISGEDLERRGAQSVEDIVKNVPGVNYSANTTEAARVTIRGISADSLANPTTGVLFGDVSFTDAYLPRVTLDPNPFDIRTVEVLKGPQGTLFGAAALNGAIRYVPEPPKFGSFEARYFAQYSWVSQGGGAPIYGAAVNLPFGSDDQFALRVTGFDRRSPGYVDDLQSGRKDVNTIDQKGLRGILGWRPGDAWDIALTYAWQETEAPDTAITDNKDGRLSRANSPQPSPTSNRYGFADLNVRYQFDAAEFVSETAFAKKRSDKLLDQSRLIDPDLPIVRQIDYNDSKTYSQELRLVSSDAADDRWRWVVGVFAMREDIDEIAGYHLQTPQLPVASLIPLLNTLLPGLGSLFTEDGQVNLLNVDVDARVQEQALFGDLTRRLGESWELSVGGRLYHTTSAGDLVQDGVFEAASTSGSLQKIIDGEIKESGFNPKASLLWHASHDVLFYTAASRGFRVGGVQPGFTSSLSAKQAPDFFKSDSLWNYELGTRTQWLHNKLHLDATGYWVDWKNPQILQTDSTIGIPYLDNAGGVRSRGVETSLQWLLPLRGLTLTNAASYTRTETSKPFTTSEGEVIGPGSPWPLAPRWQTATSLSYLTEYRDWNLGAAVTHTYIGHAYADLEQTEKVFGFQQWDLQFSLGNESMKWFPDVTLNVSNLADKRAFSSADDGHLIGPAYVDAIYIQPRMVTLRLSGRFY